MYNVKKKTDKVEQLNLHSTLEGWGKEGTKSFQHEQLCISVQKL